MDLIKKLSAEFLGTFVLVFCACGVAALTGGEIVSTALAFGLVIVAMAYSIGRISGCHINPAVSLACYLQNKLTLKEFLLYVVVQFVGGIVGAIAIFGIANVSGLILLGDACNRVIGGGELNLGNIFGSFLLETILTFIFVYVILNVTDEKSKVGNLAGIIIGFTLTLVHLVGIKLTGTSVNPARSFGTAIAAAIFNHDLSALNQVWIFLLAPLVGALIAVILFKVLHTSKEENK